MFEGRDLVGLPPHKIVRLGIARSFQRINIYPRLTVFENVQVALIAHEGQQWNLLRPGRSLYREGTAELLELVGLTREAEETAGELSYGKQKQLELAIALAAKPRLLLLDEPTAGMSPQETTETIALGARHREGARPHAALHRARHVGGVRYRRAHLGAAPRRDHRLGRARRRAQRSRGQACLPGRAAMADLHVEGIHTAYGLSQVLFGVSLDVRAGECIALIGRNGVGKTTTMRSIIGLTPPRSGSIVWKDRDIAHLGPHRVCRLGIGFVPEDRRIFPELTVWENLDIARRTGADGRTAWREEQVFALFPDLAGIRDRRGGVLSGGQQQMLTIARTLMGNPELLLLDEPSEGLAPLIVEQLRQRVAELKATGLSIVLAEQNLRFVMSLADRVYILEKGEVRFTGTPADLQADKSIVQQFLTV